MSIKSDRWIRMMATEYGMIEPYEAGQVKEVAGHISPVPGGVGPMTVAMLLKNTLRSAEILYEG